MEKKTHHDTTKHDTVKIVVGLTALAAAAAGTIFLYGTEAGKKQRKQIHSWMLRMRADVIDRMEKMKDWSEDSYYDLVDNVSNHYKNLKNIDRDEVMAIAADLKKHWRNLKRHVETGSKKSQSKKRTTHRKTKTETSNSESTE